MNAESTKKCKVNKKLLPLKAHYFLLNGAHAGVITFTLVYAEELGISASAIGIILAVLAFLTGVSKAMFGIIVDHFQKLKHVLIFLILVDVAADLGLNFIPKPYQRPVNITGDYFFCNQENSYIINYEESDCTLDFENSTVGCSISCSLCQYGSPYCLEESEPSSKVTGVVSYAIANSNEAVNLTTFFKKCLDEKDAKCTDTCFDGSDNCISTVSTNPPLQLWLLSLSVCFVYTSSGSIISLSDAACYNALEEEPQNYGKQRMWGTIGWGTFGLLTGYLNQVFTGSSKIYSYSPGFYMLVVLLAIDIIVITKLPFNVATISKNICKDVGNLLIKPQILLFIFEMYGIGIVTGISRAYVFWYLRTTLGASQVILGCLSGIQCFFGELPFFFFSGLIIRKLGHTNTFTMSFLAYGVKFFSYSFLRNPWLALPVELLQGPCYGSFYSAMTSYSKMISPDGTEATMQGIVSGTFEGLGIATGSLLGGFSFSKFGGRETFYWTGLISLTVGLTHWLVHFIKDDRHKDGQLSERSPCINS